MAANLEILAYEDTPLGPLCLVLAVWSSAESPPFVDALQRTFGRVRTEPVTFFNHLVEEETTDWIFLAR